MTANLNISVRGNCNPYNFNVKLLNLTTIKQLIWEFFNLLVYKIIDVLPCFIVKK